MASVDKPTFFDRFSTAAVRAIMALNARLSWKWQNRLTSLLGRTLVTIAPPLARRVDQNLAYIYPDMSKSRRNRIKSGAAANFCQTFFENFRSADFLERAKEFTPTGPGYEAVLYAQKQGRAVIIVSGHFGNWDAVRAVLKLKGIESGAIYRPLNNRPMEEIFHEHIAAIGKPAVGKGRQGTKIMLEHLRNGGAFSILIDQKIRKSPRFDFLGKPAETATSAADLALKFNALLVPAYGTRGVDGLRIDVEFEDPIAHSDPTTMTKLLVDSLSARVQKNPEQWYWFHQRWKLSQ